MTGLFHSPARPLPHLCGLLPVVAVWVGLYLFSSAYLAVLIYHAGIVCALCFRKPRLPIAAGFKAGWGLAFSMLCILTLPAIVLLWPFMHLPGLTLADLLRDWGMHAIPLELFAAYSILIHPWLEELYWRGLMPDDLASDLLFAVFHVLVLAKVVAWPWALLCFFCLAVAAWAWRWIARRSGGLPIPVLSHALADLGVLLAVWRLI
jgi:membrane protease YdiL (CAAX protease family)